MEKLGQLFKSRKFYAAVIGLAFVVVKAYAPNFPLAEADVLQIVLLLASYILGTGLEDARKA